jgi:AcrR family transcriptional regulator
MTARNKQSASSSYHHGDLRNALVAVGRKLLETTGIGEFSLRQVAREVGVSGAAPFRHFADKEALLAAIAEEGFVELLSTRRKLISPAGHPARTVYRMMEAYVAYAIRHPGMFDLMVGQRIPSLTAYGELSQIIDESFGLFAKAVQLYGQECGWPEKTFPALTHAAWAVEHGVAMLILSNRAPRTGSGIKINGMLRDTCALLLRGIAAGPAEDGTFPISW